MPIWRPISSLWDIAHYVIETITVSIRYMNSLDESAFERELLAAAVAACGGDSDEARAKTPGGLRPLAHGAGILLSQRVAPAGPDARRRDDPGRRAAGTIGWQRAGRRGAVQPAAFRPGSRADGRPRAGDARCPASCPPAGHGEHRRR